MTPVRMKGKKFEETEQTDEDVIRAKTAERADEGDVEQPEAGRPGAPFHRTRRQEPFAKKRGERSAAHCSSIHLHGWNVYASRGKSQARIAPDCTLPEDDMAPPGGRNDESGCIGSRR